MNIATILKVLGIKIPPETAAQIEAIIPQIPAKVQGVLVLVNSAVQNFDARLAAIEANLIRVRDTQLIILEVLENGSGDTRPAGAGANQRAIESGNGTGSYGAGSHGSD